MTLTDSHDGRGQTVSAGNGSRAMTPAVSAFDPAPEDVGARIALATLAERVLAARVLREHLVWEALRVIPQLRAFRSGTGTFEHFRSLMADGALTEALFLLCAHSDPVLHVRALTGFNGLWKCRMQHRDLEGRWQRREASHRDRGAAVLAAMLAGALTAQ